MQNDAYTAGRRVANDPSLPAANPYPPLSADWFDWRRGVMEGLRDGCVVLGDRIDKAIQKLKH